MLTKWAQAKFKIHFPLLYTTEHIWIETHSLDVNEVIRTIKCPTKGVLDGTSVGLVIAKWCVAQCKQSSKIVEILMARSRPQI